MKEEKQKSAMYVPSPETEKYFAELNRKRERRQKFWKGVRKGFGTFFGWALAVLAIVVAIFGLIGALISAGEQFENASSRSNSAAGFLYTNTPIVASKGWRPRPELNRDKGFCRAVRNHSATWPAGTFWQIISA